MLLNMGGHVLASNRPWKGLRPNKNIPLVELLSEAVMDGAVFPSVSKKM